MATYSCLSQRRAQQLEALAKAKKAHRGLRKVRRAVEKTTAELLRIEANHGRIAPAHRANAAQREASKQPLPLFGEA